MIVLGKKEHYTFEDVLSVTYDPEIMGIITTQPHKDTDGFVSFSSSSFAKEGNFTLFHSGNTREPISIQSDNLQEVFAIYIEQMEFENFKVLVQRVSDAFFNGLITKNGIYITSDRMRQVQIKSLYEAKILFTIEVKETKIDFQSLYTLIEPYIRSLKEQQEEDINID